MLTVQIIGDAPDRFRAYGSVKALRTPNAKDHYARAEAGLPPLAPDAKIRYDVDEVIAEGEVVDGRASFDADEVTISTVAFYRGDLESEVVVGSIEVGSAGQIEIQVELLPAPTREPEIIDE